MRTQTWLSGNYDINILFKLKKKTLILKSYHTYFYFIIKIVLILNVLLKPMIVKKLNPEYLSRLSLSYFKKLF